MNARTIKRVTLVAAVVLIVTAIVTIERLTPTSATPPAPSDLPASEAKFDPAPSFSAATAWVNSAPLDLASLRGKVVLVDFWTYSCINCIRTFPHVEGYYQRYQADGLVVVGVHTPEFRFERDVANIRDATQRYGLTYPVAVDSDYGIWTAYHNQYWPAEYLVDQWGRVRETKFGEGQYAATEQSIRQLLTEAGHPPTQPAGERAGADESGLPITPELYAAGPRATVADQPSAQNGAVAYYERPQQPLRDQVSLVDSWARNDENVTASGQASAIVPFHAAAANAVLDGPRGACVRVLLDGNDEGASVRGKDVRDVGGRACLVLDGPRSYDWYRGPLAEHTVELVLPDGASLFTFDFSSS